MEVLQGLFFKDRGVGQTSSKHRYSVQQALVVANALGRAAAHGRGVSIWDTIRGTEKDSPQLGLPLVKGSISHHR